LRLKGWAHASAPALVCAAALLRSYSIIYNCRARKPSDELSFWNELLPALPFFAIKNLNQTFSLKKTLTGLIKVETVLSSSSSELMLIETRVAQFFNNWTFQQTKILSISPVRIKTSFFCFGMVFKRLLLAKSLINRFLGVSSAGKSKLATISHC
jgi:hypothetical protein